MYKFKNEGGTHAEPSERKGVPAKTYPNGSIVVSEKDLNKLFPNKFTLIEEADPESEEELGNEVTGDFVEEGFEYRVFKKGSRYNVYDGNLVKLNEKSLKRAEVGAFLDTL